MYARTVGINLISVTAVIMFIAAGAACACTLDTCRAELKSEKVDPLDYSNRAALLYRERRFAEAAHELDRGLRAEGWHLLEVEIRSLAASLRGKIHVRKHAWSEAAANFELARVLDRFNLDAYIGMMVLAYQQGNAENARVMQGIIDWLEPSLEKRNEIQELLTTAGVHVSEVELNASPVERDALIFLERSRGDSGMLCKDEVRAALSITFSSGKATIESSDPIFYSRISANAIALSMGSEGCQIELIVVNGPVDDRAAQGVNFGVRSLLTKLIVDGEPNVGANCARGAVKVRNYWGAMEFRIRSVEPGMHRIVPSSHDKAGGHFFGTDACFFYLSYRRL